MSDSTYPPAPPVSAALAYYPVRYNNFGIKAASVRSEGAFLG